jgi:hypothetical protein
MTKLRIKMLAGTAILAVACLAAPLAATATAPAAVTIQMDGMLTGPTSVAGSWVATGAFDDAGTYVESVRFAGETVHVIKALTGGHGTITLEAEAVAVATSQTSLAFKAGSWRIASGTGDYASLKGGGNPAADPGSADLATGVVSITHRGFVQSN